MADYLYPLEQSGQQYVVNGRAATPEVMALEAASGEHSSFLLSAGPARVEREDRIWFRAGVPEQRIVAVGIVQASPYLYVCTTDSPQLAHHLAFRDYLRAHPDSARAYAELKKSLAQRFTPIAGPKATRRAPSSNTSCRRPHLTVPDPQAAIRPERHSDSCDI